MVEGSLTLELEGQPPRTYRAGEAFAEQPDTPHNFKNASASAPAKAIGVQFAAKGQPLQY